MLNLAGAQEADKHIKLELERARIPIEQVELDPVHNEVPYTLIGRLGNVSFRRLWYYWESQGAIPLEVARELYEDPVGATDIRVNGHAGCPPPEDWAQWITSDGKKVFPADRGEDYRGPASDLVFSDDPESVGASLYVATYHIDTEVGLRLFADTLKAHDLAGVPAQA